MASHLRFWILLYPDINRPIGGVKQLHRTAELLQELNHDCTIVQEDQFFHPKWFHSSVNTMARKTFLALTSLDPAFDFIILAETFLPAVNSIFPDIKKIIFNQNSSYSFGLPGTRRVLSIDQTIDLYASPQISQVWTVSLYDRDFLSTCIGFPTERLHLIANGLDRNYSSFHSTSKFKQIVYMPRKNSSDSEILIRLLGRHPSLTGWEILPIQNCTHDEVISIFARSLIFLSFGHPEGFGLPVAEAMACGCSVVGYSGLGGRELFQSKLALSTSVNLEYGDLCGFFDGIFRIQSLLLNSKKKFLSDLQLHATDVRCRYSQEAMMLSIRNAISRLEK